MSQCTRSDIVVAVESFSITMFSGFSMCIFVFCNLGYVTYGGLRQSLQ